MTPAKAHPYMVSFGRLGLIEQDATSGHYLLGPLALQLGLIGLQQADPVRIAAPLLAPLARAIGQTVAIAVWGARGATIVQIAEAPSPVHVSLRHGTVFSLTDTASGRLFAAFLDAAVVKQLLDAERQRERPRAGPAASRHPSWKAFEAQLQEVRRHRISRSEGEVIEGVNAMSAPVFDHTGAIVLAVIAIGPAATFDAGWDGALAHALKGCADAVSTQLGAAPDRRAAG